MNEAYLLIGGNMGNRVDYLQQAVKAIERSCGPVTARSSLYETAAWGKEDQPSFLNQALCIHTSLPAVVLLQELLNIEQSLGRSRGEKYGPRLIDIDILLYNDAVVRLPGLAIPHPHMGERRFVLVPLAEIAGEKMHPLLHRTVNDMLAGCTDPLPVHKFS